MALVRLVPHGVGFPIRILRINALIQITKPHVVHLIVITVEKDYLAITYAAHIYTFSAW